MADKSQYPPSVGDPTQDAIRLWLSKLPGVTFDPAGVIPDAPAPVLPDYVSDIEPGPQNYGPPNPYTNQAAGLKDFMNIKKRLFLSNLLRAATGRAPEQYLGEENQKINQLKIALSQMVKSPMAQQVSNAANTAVNKGLSLGKRALTGIKTALTTGSNPVFSWSKDTEVPDITDTNDAY